MLRTIWPVSGSIRYSFPEAGTAIQYLPSTHFKPWAPEGVALGLLPQTPDPGVTHTASVLPVFGSTLRVFGGVPSAVFVEPIQRAPLPSVMPLPWIDSVWICRMIGPSSGRTRNALLGSTWSRTHRPSVTNWRSLGSLQPATLNAFSTRLGITGRFALSPGPADKCALTARLPAADRKMRREYSLDLFMESFPALLQPMC